MSNIQDIRAQLRANSSGTVASRSMASPALALLMIAAVASGIIYYLFFIPVVVPLKPSASIPTFHRVNPDGSPEGSQFTPPSPKAAPANPAQYNGMTFRQSGKRADEVCFLRAQTLVPHWSKTPRLTTKELHDFDFDEMPHFNELMTCLLTEAPTRYCSSGQRSMIDAEIVMYFRGIDYGNQTLTNAKNTYQTNLASGKLHRIFGDMAGDSDYLSQIERRRLVPDSRVIGAIEARLRDSLSASDRDTIAAVAPESIRKRFADIKMSTPLCPHNPWWAFWRGW